nr:MAG: capsid protein precursor [Astroviridae sp.]QKN88939.1 MAG: capsid protein precursor [Astroviridae sp.]
MAPTQETGAKLKQQPRKKKHQGKKQKPQKQKMQTQPGGLKKEMKKVERKIKRLEKKTDGPKANDSMTTTVTLGVIQGQNDAGLNRQMRIPFNPLLMKASDGANTTPLSIRGSMYELWKVSHAELRATPLSGFSNVVGSVGFMSLTLNGLEAGADSIDTIKARKHVQMALGKPARMRLSARELAGPREGWWLVDTSEDPAEAYGPAVDLLLAYKTANLMTTTGNPTAYTGTLWQIELRATYLFSTYHPKPGLQSLVSETLTQPASVTVTTDTDGSLVMTTTNAQLMRLLEPRVGGQTGGKSQTIWAVAGAAVDAAASVMGPWGWLLKGGFWLVRKIFGAAGGNTTAKYQIYPSITAAQQDQPIYGGSGSAQVTLPVIHVSEVVNPNPESNPAQQGIASTLPGPTPPQPQVAVPFRPTTQTAPLYGYGDTSKNVSQTAGAVFLFGNFFWKCYAGTSTITYGIGGDTTQAKAVAIAELDQRVVQFGQGWGNSGNPKTGLGGALGTGTSWVNSLRAATGEWLPSPLTGGLTAPNPLKTAFGISGDGKGCTAGILTTRSTSTQKNRPNQKGYIFLYGERGFVVVGNGQADATPDNNAWLDAPLVVVLGSYQEAYRNINSATQVTGFAETGEYHAGKEDDDDISLADSFLGGGDPIEDERDYLIRRLRELDMERFTAG